MMKMFTLILETEGNYHLYLTFVSRRDYDFNFCLPPAAGWKSKPISCLLLIEEHPQRNISLNNPGRVKKEKLHQTDRESSQLQPKIIRHSSIIPIEMEFWNDTWMTEWGQNDRNEIKEGKLYWNDRNGGNALWMTKTIILTSFLSFDQNIIPSHSMLEWSWNE